MFGTLSVSHKDWRIDLKKNVLFGKKDKKMVGISRQTQKKW
jgi:hypothetical protein